MVCIPCIIAPVLLFIWYRFLQPIILKFWNPWAPKPSIQNTETSERKDLTKSTCPFTKAEAVEADLKNSNEKKVD